MAEKRIWSRREILKQTGFISAAGAAGAIAPGLEAVAAPLKDTKPGSLKAGQILTKDQVPFTDGDFSDNLYTRIGVRPLINCRGTITAISGSTSLPEVNPNAPGAASPDARFNRATQGVYELGSTFKPFTVAMAMDSGVIRSFGQQYNCPEVLPAYGHLVHDTHPFGRVCTVAEIMEESSNIGTAQIADQLGAERQKQWLTKMGFTGTVPIELKERGRALTPGSRWGPFETMTVGFGQGIAVAPVHLAMGYATLFNGGVYHPPTLLKIGPGHPLPPGKRVFSEETSYKMRALLRLVVMKGTGKRADAPGYRVGGKTGTAQKLINGHYSQTINITSFAGVFPMDEPRYVVVVMLDEPKATPETFGFTTAGWNVAPVVSRTISRIAPMLGVQPNMNREPDMSQVMPFVHETKE